MIKKYQFLDIVTDITSKFKKVKKRNYLSEGQIRIIDQGQDQIAGYSDDISLVKPELSPVIIFGDHTKVFKYEKNPLILGADGTKALKVNTKIAHDLYVYYFLKTISFQDAGYSRYFKFLKKEKIPIPVDAGGIPKIDEQIRIATLLSKVESLIARRKKSMADLDELLKSTFLEMFGDPVRNEMGWAKEKFGNMLENIDSGWSPKCEPYASKMDEWGVLKLGAVTSCIYDERENKALIQGTQFKDNLEVRAGDLLFSRKNTYELVAACAYVFKTRSKLMLSDLIFRLVLKKEARVNPIFLWKLLTNYSQRKVIQSLAGGAAGSMPNISKTKLKIVKIPVPPETLQNKFASIVEKVEALKEKYQNSLNDLETLYGALSQKAFKGELDLSRITTTIELKAEPIKVIVSAKADFEVIEKTDFGLSDMQTIIQMMNDKIFSFDEILNSIKKKNTKVNLRKKDIQGLFIQLLESESPVVEQVFEVLSSDKDKTEAQSRIGFRRCNEN